MEIVILNHLSLNRLTNAEHVQYSTNVRNIINQAGIEEIGLSELLYNPFNQAILSEQDIVNRAQGSTFTQGMKEADQERTTIFRRIRRKLELCELETVGSVQQKATAVVKKHLLGKYGANVASLTYQSKTSTITGLILDARTILSPEQIEGIGIDSDLEELQEKNTAFNEIYQQRVAEKAATDLQLSLKLRAATDKAYQFIIMSINALANDPTPANKSKVDAAREVVKKINVMISEVKARLNKRGAGEEQTGDDSGNTSGDSGSSNNTGTDNTDTGSGSGNTNSGNTTGNQPYVPSDSDDMMG